MFKYYPEKNQNCMKKYIVAVFITLYSLSALTQKISVDAIREIRTTIINHDDPYIEDDNNFCLVTLRISGNDLNKYQFIKLDTITKATDDQGIDLLLEKENNKNSFDYLEIYTSDDEPADPIQIGIALKSASRKATTLKELQGSIKVVSLSEENKGIVKITKYRNKPYTNLLANNSPIGLFYLTEEFLDTFEQIQLGKKEEAKKLSVNAQMLAKEIMNVINKTYYISDMGEKNDPDQITLYCNGDISKLIKIVVENEKGEEVPNSGFIYPGGLFTFSDFEEKPNPNWRIVVYMESEGATKTIPFSFNDIKLP